MKRIIIDCDPGIDDAQAIMMAYMHPDVSIEAITTVVGNVNIRQTTSNVLKILDVLEADEIPVYAGAHSGLVESGENASLVHGEDGLGDIGLSESKRHVQEEPAALALIQLAKQNPGELELIAIGPLTNLALALRLDPDLPSRYKRLVIMGGAYHAQGNTSSLPAEFNIYSDPEAAFVVFNNWPKLTMVTWEATIAHGMPIDAFRELISSDNPRSKCIKKMTEKMIKVLKMVHNQSMSYAADPLAMAVLMEPEIVKESIHKHVQIERYGKISRGMTVVDWWEISEKSPNTEIVLRVDTDRFIEMLKMAFE